MQLAFSLFPRNSPDALLSGFYVELTTKKTAPLNLQKTLSAAVYARANTDHLTLLSQPSASQDIDKEDVIAAHAKSQFTRIFTAPLSDHYNIMNPNRFVAWTRAFLRIPQLPHLGSLSDRHNLQYQTEVCLSGHALGKHSVLDLHGNHACSNCPSASAGLHRRHTLLKCAVFYLAQEAGCRVDMEPQTQNLLLGLYSKQQCMKLFPRHVTKAQSTTTRKLLDNFALLRRTTGPARSAMQHNIDTLFNSIQPRKDARGLRIDLQIENTETRQLLWVDTTCVHSTCKSRLDAEHKRNQQNIALEAHSPKLPGKAAEDQTAQKHSLYAPLVAVAEKQHMDGFRDTVPRFLAVVTTTHGELGSDTFFLQEWLIIHHG
jgi:hypothetical protein